jgi:hypothetical protein
MITTIKDEDRKVICFCEWRLVGQSGFEMENGKYVWVNDLWIHESVRGQSKLYDIIEDIFAIVPETTEYCYFQRKEHNNRVRIFTRSQMERMRDKLKEKVR